MQYHVLHIRLPVYFGCLVLCKDLSTLNKSSDSLPSRQYHVFVGN